MVIWNDIAHNVAAGDVHKIALLTEDAIREECKPQQIIDEGGTAALRCREQYSAGQIFPPGMLMASLAVSNAIPALKPPLEEMGTISKGNIVIGAVLGTIHDIGRNIIAMMCDEAGFRVIDLR